MTSAVPPRAVRTSLTVLPESTHGAGASTSLASLDARLKALADPTRMRILNLLWAGELCVCDVVELLSLPQPTVSRHLGALRRAGMVRVTREWKFAHYRLAQEGDAMHRALLGCVEAAPAVVPELIREREAARARAQARRGDPCE
jgi:ArsR family transcriptional regulator, arsenate/arsenite/antimonite-responsive transcriptional repressor